VAQAKLSKKQVQEAVDAVAVHGTINAAARVLKAPEETIRYRVRAATRYKIKPTPGLKPAPVVLTAHQKNDLAQAQQALDAFIQAGSNESEAARSLGIARSTLQKRREYAERHGLEPQVRAAVSAEIEVEKLKTVVLAALKQHPHTVAALAARLKITEGLAHEMCKALYDEGHNVFRNSENVYSVEKTPVPYSHDAKIYEFESDARGYYKFGVVSDTHLCSKYYRPDVLNSLYQWFANEGITRVYHAGNWIEGEAPFNKHDISVHGMDAQCRYLAEHYPHVPGITTYAVTGDDHEGWIAQREGVDIGRYAERTMRDAGRDDWVNLGYMESFISLRHQRTHRTSQMLVMHPGGGSAYALSYQPQKIVESLAGGEKPAVLLIGHYHKLEFLNVRNTWVLQCGTTKDQDPFLRKKRIEVHIGGSILELWQDDGGAIPDARVHMKRFFNTGYYQDRFSHSGPVILPAMMQGAR
jgi:predicted phosphodiesterase/transposase-like protein